MTLKNRLQRQVSPTEGSNSGAKMEVLIYFFERDTYGCMYGHLKSHHLVLKNITSYYFAEIILEKRGHGRD
jgi:hypothetical protein